MGNWCCKIHCRLKACFFSMTHQFLSLLNVCRIVNESDGLWCRVSHPTSSWAVSERWRIVKSFLAAVFEWLERFLLWCRLEIISFVFIPSPPEFNDTWCFNRSKRVKLSMKLEDSVKKIWVKRHVVGWVRTTQTPKQNARNIFWDDGIRTAKNKILCFTRMIWMHNVIIYFSFWIAIHNERRRRVRCFSHSRRHAILWSVNWILSLYIYTLFAIFVTFASRLYSIISKVTVC